MSVRIRFAAVLLSALLLTLCLPAVTAASDPAPDEGYQPGYIQLNTTPDGAEVFINGTKMNGTTPFTVKVPVMVPQEIVVIKFGYKPDRRLVTVPQNATVPLDLTLSPIDQPGAAASETSGRGTSAAGPAGTWEEAPLSPVAALVALLVLGLSVAARRR